MPATFAPPIKPFPAASPFSPPVVLPGANDIVPFPRTGAPVPKVPPPLIRPPGIPTPPPSLPVPSTTLPGLLRVGGVGAAAIGAGALGLGIGNAIYEDLLNRPFGPSIGDLLFPAGQPQRLPARRQAPGTREKGKCETQYLIEYEFLVTKGDRVSDFSNSIVRSGPIQGLSVGYESSKVVFLDIAYNGIVERVQRVGSSLGSVGTPSGQILDIQRRDGLPDDCGDVLPSTEPTPRSTPRPEPLQPHQIPRIPDPLRFPQPIPSPRRSPNPQPQTEPSPLARPQPVRPFIPATRTDPGRNPLPVPLRPRLPQPVPLPPPLPQPQPEPERRVPPTSPLLCCASVEIKLDELLRRREPEKCDLSEIEDALRDVLEKLAGDGSGHLDISDCDADVETLVPYVGDGLTGIYSAIAAITKSLNSIHEDTMCLENECVASVPDWWQVRKGAGTPQLSIVLRKVGTRNYHSINIPHPVINPPPTVSPISQYTGGNWQAMIYCIDNSKLIVNARTKTEAIRVATEAAQIIRPDMLASPLQISTTERRGFEVNQSLMVPRYADYHPEGQKRRRPQWRVRFDE